MKIYLVRHGETTGDIEDRYGGDYDDNLSPKGIKESKALAQKLQGRKIEIIYVSPRIRALETASIVNKKLNVGLKIVENLKERNNYGVLTGLIKSEAKERHPEEVKKLETGFNHNVKKSESYPKFKKRITKAFYGIIKNDSYKTITIITHGNAIRCIIREILKSGELKSMGDCAIFTINKNGSRLSLVKLDGASLERKNKK